MIYEGDCIEVMQGMDPGSIDAVVCDPPYGLAFMGKGWDSFKSPAEYQRWCERWAREASRVLKPGGHLLAFGGTRTNHRLVSGIEDAGYEIRDTLAWMYGSGFPKSHDVSKAIDKLAGAEREVIGPSARHSGRTSPDGTIGDLARYGDAGDTITAPATEDAARWAGWGTALKPAHEPICLARKPLQGTVAANVLAHGTGALNIDGTRIAASGSDPNARANKAAVNVGKSGYGGFEQPDREWDAALGRWPANVLLDEAAAAMLGEPSRFFYCAKASTKERSAGLDERSKHPTVKPIAVMEWLLTLVAPPGAVILDPFLGSGSTAIAAINLGVKWIGIEADPAFARDAQQRVASHVQP